MIPQSDRDMVLRFAEATFERGDLSDTILRPLVYGTYYSRWCRERGERGVARNAFYAVMRELYGERHLSCGVHLVGVRLRQSEQPKQSPAPAQPKPFTLVPDGNVLPPEAPKNHATPAEREGIARFLSEIFEPGTRSDLFLRPVMYEVYYRGWCRMRNAPLCAKQAFNEVLRETYNERDTGKGNCWVGIKLKEIAPEKVKEGTQIAPEKTKSVPETKIAPVVQSVPEPKAQTQPPKQKPADPLPPVPPVPTPLVEPKPSRPSTQTKHGQSRQASVITPSKPEVDTPKVRNFARICETCGNEFKAVKPSARYCGNGCRGRAAVERRVTSAVEACAEGWRESNALLRQRVTELEGLLKGEWTVAPKRDNYRSGS